MASGDLPPDTQNIRFDSSLDNFMVDSVIPKMAQVDKRSLKTSYMKSRKEDHGGSKSRFVANRNVPEEDHSATQSTQNTHSNNHMRYRSGMDNLMNMKKSTTTNMRGKDPKSYIQSRMSYAFNYTDNESYPITYDN